MKKYLVLIVTVILLAGGAYYTQQYFIELSANNSANGVATTTDEHSDPVAHTAAVVISHSLEVPAQTPTTISPAAAQTPNVIFSVPDASYSLYAQPDTTVLGAMRILASTSDFTFSGHDYPSLGFFVESIHGKTAGKGHVWIFYVNGEKSQKGISQTILSAGDTIEWKYEKSY